MNTGDEAEKYVKSWCEQNGQKFIKGHSKGYDLIMRDEIKGRDIFIEVKGSAKEKFEDVRPYIRMNQLKLALEKGKNYEFHILLGFKGEKPKKHYRFSGQDLIEYRELIDKAVEFRKKLRKELSKIKCSKTFSKPDIEIFLKKNIGKLVA